MVRRKVRLEELQTDAKMETKHEWKGEGVWGGAASANKKWSDVQENEANRKYPSEGGKCLEHRSNFSSSQRSERKADRRRGGKLSVWDVFSMCSNRIPIAWDHYIVSLNFPRNLSSPFVYSRQTVSIIVSKLLTSNEPKSYIRGEGIHLLLTRLVNHTTPVFLWEGGKSFHAFENSSTFWEVIGEFF